MDKVRAMRFYCRAVEEKSFSGAAQALDVVPSALSKTIAALERELGFPLLNRSTRGLSPTESGATYYERCREILRDIENAEAMGRDDIAGARGTLRIGMHPALRFELMTAMGALLDAHPQLRIETVTTNSPAAVIDDGMDLLVHVGRLPDSGLISRQIGWVRPIVCASPAYLAARPPLRHPAELTGHRAVVHARRDEDPNARWSFTRGAERCEVDIAARVVVRDGIGLIDAALGGAGVTRLSEIAVRRFLARGQLHEVLPEWIAEMKPITAVLPQTSRPPPLKVQLYLDHLTKVLHSSRHAPADDVARQPRRR